MLKFISNFFSKFFVKKQKVETPQTFQEFVDSSIDNNVLHKLDLFSIYKKISEYGEERSLPNYEKNETRKNMISEYIKENKIKRGTLIFRNGKVIEPFPEFTIKLPV